jgi:hypothetical protein
MIEVIIGHNRRFIWMKKKGEKTKIVLEFEGYRSYAQKAMANFLSYYTNLEARGRLKVALPEDEFYRTIDLMNSIKRFDLARFKGFRSEFDGIRAGDPGQYLDALEEIVTRYTSIRVLQKLLK